MPPDIIYDFFIAHAGPSAEKARELYNSLAKTHRVFLDVVSLSPGDQWAARLAEAQAASTITVALVCGNFQNAYYAHEEVAAGISFERNWGEHRHRVVPIYLDGFPTVPNAVTYGLRCKHALDVKKLGGLIPAAMQLVNLLEEQPTAIQQSVAAPAHPLLMYPRGPMVQAHLVKTDLIQDYAKLISPFETKQVIADAIAFRLEAEPGNDSITYVQMHHLPPPYNVPQIVFWSDAFVEARKHGPRMLAALLMVVPDDMFGEKAKANRRELLNTTLRYNPT